MIQNFSEKTRRNLHDLLPGLVHFGERPWDVMVQASSVKWIRIWIPSLQILSLNSVVIKGPSSEDMASATVSMSSKQNELMKPLDLLSGKPASTLLEVNPYWQINFKKPTEITSIQCRNRVGVWAARAYGLRVSLGKSDGTTEEFDQAASHELLLRLGAFQVQTQELLDSLSDLPKPSAASYAPLASRVSLACAEIVRGAVQLLQGCTYDIQKLTAVRSELIEALVSLNEALTGKELGQVLARSSTLLGAALDRTMRSKEWTPSVAEMEAVATIFVHRYIVKRQVVSDTILEHQAFLPARDQINYIEDRVNALYERITGDTSVLPIMFRAHSMKGSELQANAPRYVAAMKEVAAIMESIGYTTAICYGTLLGAVRTGSFIPHDDDVDMAMVMKSNNDDDLLTELAEIVSKLRSLNVSASITPGFKFLKVKAPNANRTPDVFPILLKDDSTVRMYMEQLKIRDVPSDVVLPFGEIEFLGETFKAPSSPKGFLSQRYGESWHVPQRRVGSITVEA